MDIDIVKNPLGTLESCVMEAMWKREEATVRDVMGLVCREKKLAYTTVMTVMSRLADKGLLERDQDASGAYVYVPAISREDFMRQAASRGLEQLMRLYPDHAPAAIEKFRPKNRLSRR